MKRIAIFAASLFFLLGQVVAQTPPATGATEGAGAGTGAGTSMGFRRDANGTLEIDHVRTCP